MMNRIITVTVAAIFSLPACVPVCRVNDSRCFDGCVEICNSRGQWDLVAECDEVWSAGGAEWTCCPLALEDGSFDGHACLPAAVCEEDAE